jgi:Dolichyl-phosphate-mannose-protein mannosyltransferase
MGSMPSSANASWSLRIHRFFDFFRRPPVILLLLVALVISRGISQGEFFFYYDEMTHAMNGVFFRDSILDFPWRHPMEYAVQYYAKYPAISFPHWPPLFHFIEGLFFLVFGLAPWVSRLAVLSFALMGAYFWYRIAERLGPQYRAFLSALTIACIPFILLYERVAMLEVPSLATCLATIYFWLKFQDTGRRRDLWAIAGFATIAFLVSQKAIFLVFFFALHCLVERPYRLLKRIDVWLAAFISFLAVLPWYVLASKTLSQFWTRAIGNHKSNYLTHPTTYSFYLRQVYLQLGPILLGVACVGLVVALLKRTSSHRFLVTWIFAGYFCFTVIREKDPRHTMIWIPPLLYLAFVAIDTVLVRRTWALVVSSALAFGLLAIALRTPRPIVQGAREAAHYVLSQPDSDIIYYQGRLNCDFIFFARKFDPQKMRVVARDKQIVGRSNVPPFAPDGMPTAEQQVLNFFQTWGIRYAVVEDPDLFASFGPVHQIFYSPQFELVRTFPVYTNWPDISVRQIQVFRYRGDLQRTEESITVPVETIHNDIHLTLSQIAGHPWPK